MIQNSRQYNDLKRQLTKWSTLRRRLDILATDFSIDATELLALMDNRAVQFEISLNDYETLQNTEFEKIDLLRLVSRLPTLLIEARIASGWTQTQLAARIGIKSQQLHRYEKTAYSSIGLSKALEIADILHAELRTRKAALEKLT